MTPPLEWTGYLPAAVSAVHALSVLLRLRRERVPDGGGPRRSHGAAGRRGHEEHRCIAGPSMVRVDVTVPPTAVALHVVITTDSVPGGGTAGEERDPW
ncbi:hypothetical protein [Streptomyces noursei]|uniref:hypothetical protein n=1 Tax=Streptomyces noursei TaxID=1971 RepID=UPI0019AC8022|nr:hypothetical protein [Streptomyces noursei]MCZ1012934.1 hypothetical protein [Streptomyces noursei]GGX21147.1 hypothetical protein GCM10010341_48150 [Streptomyces noursei]